MSEQSGKEVRTAAKLFFLLILISMFACGVISCRSVSMIGGKNITWAGFFTFLLFAGVGAIVAWISSIMINAFGEIVENTGRLNELEEDSKKILEHQEQLKEDLKQILANQSLSSGSEKVRICPVCHAENKETDRYCSKCHQYLGENRLKNQEVKKQPKKETTVYHSKVCPKCSQDNPAAYLYCQYCGEKLD